MHGVSALERGERRRPHVETVRALSAALDLTGTTRDAFLRSARAPAGHAAADELIGVSLPVPPTAPGLFPIDAAAAVLAGRERATAGYHDALHAAAGLMDKSLLLRAETSVVPTCPLYCMLDTVRAYAARELAVSGERDEALEGLVQYCLDEASLAVEGWSDSTRSSGWTGCVKTSR